MSQLTTHILDTSLGRPAKNVAVILEHQFKDHWIKIAEGTTNDDGRITDLLKEDMILKVGNYRLIFETAFYFQIQKIKTFYPRITIEFEIVDQSHYHVPLLLNPYGYSTYRGS